MLTILNNIDRSDESTISNWPFTYESTMETGDGQLIVGSFLSILVYTDEDTQLPCRLKGVTQDGKLVVCDATGAEICSCQLYPTVRTDAVTGVPDELCSFFLYNRYNVMSGIITCKSNVALKLFDLSRYANGMHYFGASAFVFLPQCHVPFVRGSARSYGVNGVYRTANLTIRCTTGSTAHNVIPEGKNQPTSMQIKSVSYGVFNLQPPVRNKWCQLSVGGTTYNVEGKNLIVKAALASNLRVIQTDAAIILRGVEDAQ